MATDEKKGIPVKTDPIKSKPVEGEPKMEKSQNEGIKKSTNLPEKTDAPQKADQWINVKGMKIPVQMKELGFQKTVDDEFRPGDTLRVHNNIREGEKSRIQIYEGVLVRKKGAGLNKTITVRRITNDIAVERIFLLNSPFIEKIEVKTRGMVRRAHLSYLRQGNRMRKIKEKRPKRVATLKEGKAPKIEKTSLA